MKVKFNKLNPGVQLSCGTKHSVGIDVSLPKKVTLEPGLTMVDLGFTTDMEEDYFALLSLTKSSIAVRGLMVLAGVIDSDYKNEWVAMFYNPHENPVVIEAGVKLLQIVFLPKVKIESEEIDFKPTKRIGGFGSTQ